MPPRHKRKTRSLVVKAAELAFAMPQVVAHRVMRMAIAGPSVSERDRKEFQRMSAEKMTAIIDSWNAMTMQALRANQALAASFLRSFCSPLLKGRPSISDVAARLNGSALGVLGKGLAPSASESIS